MATHNPSTSTSPEEDSNVEVTRLQGISLEDTVLNLGLPIMAGYLIFAFAAAGYFFGVVAWWLMPLLIYIAGLILMFGNKRRLKFHTPSSNGLLYINWFRLLVFSVLLVLLLALVNFGSQPLLGIALAQYAGWIIGNDNLGYFRNVERGHIFAQVVMLLTPHVMAWITGFGISGLLNASSAKSTRPQPDTEPVAEGEYKWYRTAKRRTSNAGIHILRFLSNGFVALLFTVLGLSFWMGISMIVVSGF